MLPARASCPIAVILCGLIAVESVAATRYHVRINTTGRLGQAAQMVFDFTSGEVSPDSLEIQDFAHNGTMGAIAVPGFSNYEGGPVRGDLLDGLNPAPRTVIGNDFFYGRLVVPFNALGTATTFAFQLPEPSPPPSAIPDQVAFYFFRANGLTSFVTGDPLGTDALFAVDVTGGAGGDLSVFSPMTFIPPDTLAVDLSIVNVPETPAITSDRLRFISVDPNPALEAVRLAYEVPEPGGFLRIKVFDVAGRLVAEPFKGHRQAGSWTTRWEATDARGHAVAAGVYILQLQMEGQSRVRRIVLTR